MPLSPRDPGPVEAAPPAPVPHVVPHMTEHVAADAPLVRKVTEADLAVLLDWLVPAMQDHYPALQPEGLVSWLRAAFTDPHSLLVATPRVCALFAVERWPTGAIVKERWCRTREQGCGDEAVALYRYALDWAQSLGLDLVYGEDSDAPMVRVQQDLFDPKRNIKVRKSVIYHAYKA